MVDQKKPDITSVGLVAGVNLTTLAALVASHHDKHTIWGNIDSRSETIYVDTYTFRTSSDGVDDEAIWETAKASPASRSHHHAVGSYYASSTIQSTGITPVTTDITINKLGIVCRLIKAVCPKDLWAKYQNHRHKIDGTSESVTPSALGMVGNSGNTFFRVSYSSSGSSPFWSTVSTGTAAHSHGPGSLELGATGAGAAPTSVGTFVEIDGDDIDLDGNVNGVDVDAFNAHLLTYGGTNTNGRHQGTGESALGGATSSQLRAGSSDTWFETTSGWVRAYVYPNSSGGAQHTHAASGLSGRKA